MAEIIWTNQAVDCLEHIHEYIARDNPDAAYNVICGIYDKIQILGRQPRIGHRLEEAVDREIREILYRQYRIPYLVRSESHVEILGVFHGAMEIEQFLD